jgi:hypothetical protein
MATWRSVAPLLGAGRGVGAVESLASIKSCQSVQGEPHTNRQSQLGQVAQPICADQLLDHGLGQVLPWDQPGDGVGDLCWGGEEGCGRKGQNEGERGGEEHCRSGLV